MYGKMAGSTKETSKMTSAMVMENFIKVITLYTIEDTGKKEDKFKNKLR
jgi:hypothetical protein